MESNKIFKTIAKNSSLSFLLRIVGNFIGIIIAIILTRGIGAEYYGIYSLSLSIILISSKISLFGMNNAILRFFPVYKKNKKDLRGLIVTSFSVALLLSGAVLALHYEGTRIYVKIFNIAGLEDVIIKFAILLPLIVFIQLVASLFQAEKNIVKYINFSELYQKIFLLIILFTISMAGLNLSKAVYAFGASIFLVFIMSLVEFNTRFFPQIKQEKAQFRIKELLHFSAPSFLIGFSFILLMQIDRIMVGILMDSYHVGLYAVSAKIAILMNIILVSMNSIFVPYISDLYWNKREQELASIFKIVTKWTWIFSIVLFVGFFYGAEYILQIFGAEFSSGKSAFILLAFGFLLNCGFGSNGFMLQMTGNQSIELVNSIVVLILNIIFNILLVPAYGIAGAALATCLSMFLINIARLIEFFILSGIHPISKAWIKVSVFFIFVFLSTLFLKLFFGDGLVANFFSFLIFSIFFSIFIYKSVLTHEDIIIVTRIKQRFVGIL